MVAHNFKSDDSFKRKLAVGAKGTNLTILRLKEMGFCPIELERGSTGFKIWKKIKIKRVRVPDILCLHTGLRFEARGKTKPEISMSHSLKDANRQWSSGMRDDDVVSIVVFEQGDDTPLEPKQISPVHFVKVSDLREAFDHGRVTITTPKGAEEGSEIRVVWTCATARQRSVVSDVAADRMKLIGENGISQLVKLVRKGDLRLSPQVHEGDTVEANQIVAAVVPVETQMLCPADIDESCFINRLGSMSVSERYAAAKALRYLGYAEAEPSLKDRMNDPDEDIYVQLEAAAALAANDDEGGWEFIESRLRSAVTDVPLETQLESIIVASEIHKERAQGLLLEVLEDHGRHEELRAGAAWGLGQFPSTKTAGALAATFGSTPEEVRIEAARALLRIADQQIPHLVNLFRECDPSWRDGIAWVLARTGKFDPAALACDDLAMRQWASYIIGYGRDRFEPASITAICNSDPEVYFAGSVLWQILASWVHELEEC